MWIVANETPKDAKNPTAQMSKKISGIGIHGTASPKIVPTDIDTADARIEIL